MAVAAAWENLQVLKLSAERRAELSWDERDERDANRIIYTIHTRGTRPPACARCTLRVYTLDTARHDNIFWKRYIYVEIRLLSSACWLYNKRRLLFFFLSFFLLLPLSSLLSLSCYELYRFLLLLHLLLLLLFGRGVDMHGIDPSFSSLGPLCFRSRRRATSWEHVINISSMAAAAAAAAAVAAAAAECFCM